MGAKRHEALGGLTPKEYECCRLYVMGPLDVRGNQTEAFKRTFCKDPNGKKYKRNSIWNLASRFFLRAEIRDTVQEMYKEMNQELTEEYIKHQIKNIAQRAKKESDKLRGYELLGKTHAMFREKVEQEVKIEGLVLSEEGFEDDKE